MKKILILAGTGIALFVGTVVGMLAAKGRLNHEGVRGIPILESLLTPEGDADGELQAEHAEEEGDHEQEQDKPSAPLTGPSKIAPPEGEGGHGGGHAATTNEGHTAPMPTVVKRDSPLADTRKPEDVLSRERHFPPAMFRIQRQVSAMGKEDLERIRLYIDKQDALLGSKEKALFARQSALAEREANVKARYANIDSTLTSIRDAQTQLDLDIEEFNKRCILAEKGALNDLKTYARDLELLADNDIEKAKDLVINMWGDEDSKRLIMKVLREMKADPFHEILVALDVKTIKDVLNRKFDSELKDKKGK